MSEKSNGKEHCSFGIKTVLVADDEKVSRSILADIFSSRYSVLQADDGADTLNVLHSQHVDAVVLDIEMPRIGGYEILEHMQNDPFLVSVPVLAITESGDEQNEIKALDFGARDIISKPFSRNVILRRLGNMIDAQEAVNLSKQNEQKYDDLTGLLNRQAFVAEARKLISSHKAGSYEILCVDIDNFKIVNDRFGHSEGDRLLKYISEAALSEIVKKGGIACRNSADIFLMTIPYDGLAFDEALPNFMNLIKNYDLPLSLSAHIGRCIIDDADTDFNLYIDRAIIAVRSIKGSAEKTTCFFSEEMRKNILRLHEMTSEMRTALLGGEFVPFFQPQFNYFSDEMTGAEALVRWNHPKKGIIPPSSFIPLFENNGFISQLDRYIWEEVCRLLRKWIDDGAEPISISVNISRKDVNSLDLPDVFGGLIKKYNLPAKLLRLEITESAYTEHPQRLVSAIRELQKLGFSVEMDDFGSGYSSLNTLKDVPVDLLKLDMGFVNSSEEHSKGGRILSSVVRMAHWLKLPVIAEGVETKEQADYLKSIGCPVMQGYLFAKPMPVEEFEELLSTKAKAFDRLKTNGVSLKGSAEFLDASTQATLLFNSFVGGAAIMEYNGDNLEFLRANDRFFEVVGYERKEYEQTHPNIFEHFDSASRLVLRSSLEEAISTGKETQCELHSLPEISQKPNLWTFNRIRLLAQSEQNYLFYISTDNITERKELEETRLNLDSIVNNVPAGITISAFDGNIRLIFASEKAKKLFGICGENISSEKIQKITDQFLPSLNKQLSNFDREVFYTGQALENTFIAERADGSKFWLRVISSLVRRKDLSPLIYSTFFDVTNQKNRDDDYENFVNLIPGGVFKGYVGGENLDKVGFISDSLLRMTGYTRHEFENDLHSSFTALTCPEDRERVYNSSVSQLAEKKEASIEYRIITKSGEKKWVNVSGHQLRGTDGKDWVYTVVLDYDVCKKLESNLNEQREKARALIANAPCGVIVFAHDGKRFYVEYFSEGLSRMLGYEHEDLREKLLSDPRATVFTADFDRIDKAATVAAKSLSKFNEDYRLVRKDGKVIWVNLIGSPVSGSDDNLRFYCTYSEITERVESEAAAKASAEELKIVIRQSGKYVISYNIKTKAGTDLVDAFTSFDIPKEIVNYEKYIIENHFIRPESVVTCKKLFREIESGKKEGSCSLSLHLPDGRISWFRIDYNTIFDEKGLPDHAIIFFSDTYEQIENIRRQKIEHELSSIFGEIPGGFYSGDFNKNGNLSLNYISDPLCSAVGYTGEEIAEMFFSGNYKIIASDFRAQYSEFIEKSFSEPGIRVIEHQVLHNDGSLLFVKETIKSIYNDDGTVSVYAAVADITKEHEALRKLKALTDSVPGGISVVKYSDGKFSMSYFNDTFCRITGYSHNELESLTKEDALCLLKDNYREAFPAFMSDILSSRKEYSEQEAIINTKTGTKWVRIIAKIIEQGPKNASIYLLLIDINKQKSIENRLAFRNLCMNEIDKTLSAGTIISSLDFSNPPLYISENVENLLGYTPEEIGQMYITLYKELIHPDDFAQVAMLTRKYTSERPPYYEMEYRFIRKDGSILWVVQKSALLPDFEGIPAYLSIFVDISKQKSIEDELRIDEEAYRVAVAHTNSLVYCYDIKSKCFGSISKGFHTAEQIKVPEIIAEGSFVYQDDREILVDFFASIEAGIEDKTAEVRHMMPDGNLHWFKAEYSLINSKSGEPISAIITFTDISSEKKKEEEISSLKENELLLQIMARHSKRFIVLYDYSSDTFRPCDSSVNILSNVLPLFPCPLDYLKKDIIAPESIADVKRAYNCLRRGENGIDVKFRAKALDGNLCWFNTIISVVPDSAGNPKYAIASFDDISDSYEKEVAYQRYQSLMAAASDKAFFMDYNLTRDTMEGCSPGFVENLGTGSAHLGFSDCIFYVSAKYVFEPDRSGFCSFFDKGKLLVAFAKGISGDMFEFRIFYPGSEAPIYANGRYQMITDPYSSDIRVLFSCEIIDERKRAELELIDRAENDSVTHIYNRATFIKKMQECLTEESGNSFAFAMLDLDCFKDVNDTLGHAEGDHVLWDISRSIQSVISKSDLFGRLGGDEFGVFFGHFSDKESLEDKLRIIITSVFRELEKGVRISASIGVAIYPNDGKTFDELYEMSDIALYRAKNNGKNHFVFYSDDMRSIEKYTALSPIDE